MSPISQLFGYLITAALLWMLFARLSIAWFSPFRPRTRRAKLTVDVAGIKVIRHAIVWHGRGKVARLFVDDDIGAQHAVVVWGAMLLLPNWLLTRVFAQIDIDNGGGDRHFLSFSLFPCSHLHLLDFGELYPGDKIDLRGAQILEMFDGNVVAMGGCADLCSWIHGKCAWLAPGDADLSRLSVFGGVADAPDPAIEPVPVKAKYTGDQASTSAANLRALLDTNPWSCVTSTTPKDPAPVAI